MERKTLRELGLADVELRWLVCRNYAEQGQETVREEDNRRHFEADQKNTLVFNRRTCFVLTAEGVEYLNQLNVEEEAPLSPVAEPAPPLSDEAAKPVWDRDRQELRLGGQVVKQFKVPAPNQELILASFEEEGWPVHIDDPLPLHPELDPKQRLHDTINSLNRKQRCRLVRFSGNGKGNGVRWECAGGSSWASAGDHPR